MIPEHGSSDEAPPRPPDPSTKARSQPTVAIKPGVKPKEKIFYGWWIVLAGALLNAYNNGVIYYGFTAYFNPIINEFGWSRAATSLAFSIKRTEEGLAAPLVGFLFDRLGGRKLVVVGAIIGGLGLILMGRVQNLGAFYGSVVVVTLGVSLASYLVCVGTIAHWFFKRRGLALSLLAVGSGLGGVIVPVVVWLVTLFGWRNTLTIGGIGLWAIGIPVGLAMRHRPEQYGYLPDGNAPKANPTENPSRQLDATVSSKMPKGPESKGLLAKEALRTPSFWLLAIIYLFSAGAMSGIMLHSIPALTDAGLPVQTAGFIAGLVPIVSILGRISSGWLSDRVENKYVLACAAALISVGTLSFAYSQTLWQFAISLFLFSTGQGALVPLRGTIIGQYFGTKAFGAIYGLLQVGNTLGSAIGPVFAGRVFDLSHTYTRAFVVLGLAAALSVPLALVLKRTSALRMG